MDQINRVEYNCKRAALQQAPRDAAFAFVWEQGSAFDVERAIAFARSEAG